MNKLKVEEEVFQIEDREPVKKPPSNWFLVSGNKVEPEMVVFFNNCKVLNWSFIRPVSSMSQVPVKNLCFASLGKVFGSGGSYVGNLGIVQGLSKREKLSEFF